MYCALSVSVYQCSRHICGCQTEIPFSFKVGSEKQTGSLFAHIPRSNFNLVIIIKIDILKSSDKYHDMLIFGDLIQCFN